MKKYPNMPNIYPWSQQKTPESERLCGRIDVVRVHGESQGGGP